MLNCIDNSGAAVVECVNVLRKKRPATLGMLDSIVIRSSRKEMEIVLTVSLAR